MAVEPDVSANATRPIPAYGPAGGGAGRILEAAVELFGQNGVNATSLKSIAARAKVSPALILHHFGSKDALRTACDECVATVLRTTKTSSVRQPNLDLFAVASMYEEYRPMIRYLARTLNDGSPYVNDLIDEMVADAEAYSAEAERSGLMKPSADPKARIALLMIWSMGGVVLHEHLERLLGVDLLGSQGYPTRYVRAVMELYSQGVFTENAFAELRNDLPAHQAGEKEDTHD